MGLADCGGGGGSAIYALPYTAVLYQTDVKKINEFSNGAREKISDIGSALWDAYAQGYTFYQNAEMQSAQMMQNGMRMLYDCLEETNAIAVGMDGYHATQAAIEAKKAIAYLALPIPTPADEYLAAVHLVKASYHLYKVFEEE